MKSLKEILMEWEKRSETPSPPRDLIFDRSMSHDYSIRQVEINARKIYERMQQL